MSAIVANTGSNNWNTNGAWVGSVQPTNADDVTIPATANVTIPAATTVVARSVTVAASATLTMAATTSTLNIGDGTAGAANVALSVSSSATITLTAGTPTITFISTSATQQTIDTGGKTFGVFAIGATGSSYKLISSLTTTQALSVTAGTVDFNGQTINCLSFSSSNGNTRTITLGSASITCTTGSTSLNFANSTGLTISSNTATFTLTGAAAGANVNNINMNGASITFSGSGVAFITNPGTWATVTRTGTAVKTDGFAINTNNLTCSTLIVSGNSTVNRIFMVTDTPGVTRTVSVSTTITLSNVDFMDITAAGAGTGWATGTSIGDCLGNSGITFTVNAGTSNGGNGVNRYWVGNSGTGDVTSVWSTSSGGSSGASVPLPQDDIYFDVNSFNATSQRAQLNMPQLCRNFDTTGTNRASTTIGTGSGTNIGIFGNLKYAGTAVDDNNATGQVTYYGRGSQTITGNGSTRNGAQLFIAPGGTYTLQDDFNIQAGSNKNLTVSYGTFDANNKNVSAPTYFFNATLTLVKMGSGTWTITRIAGATVWNYAAAASTLQAQTSTIKWDGNQSGAHTFAGGGASYATVQNNQGNYALNVIITGANYFDTLTVGSMKSITFPNGVLNTVKNWNGTGVSNGYLYLSGSGAYVSVPDSAATSITGNITLACRVALDDWTPAVINTLQTKWNSGSQRSYAFIVDTTGKLRFDASSAGTAANISNLSTAATGFTDGTDHWVAVTYNSSTGDVKFWTAAGGSNTFPTGASWTQLGTTVSNSAISIFDGTAVYSVGGEDTGTVNPPFGKFYHAVLCNNVLLDGTGIQCDMDFTAKAFGANTFTESSSNAATATLNGVVTQAGDGRVLVKSALSGTAAQLALYGPVNTLNYQTVQDIHSMIPFKYYAGANSVLISGNTNVATGSPTSGVYIVKDAPIVEVSATSNTGTFSGGQTATAGNMLVAFISGGNTFGTVTTPSGWTANPDNPTSTTANNRVSSFYKIATGGETGVTISYGTSATTDIWVVELGGFVGTPTFDVHDHNADAGSTVTSLVTGSGVTNSTNPAYALAAWAFNNTPGAWVSNTNSWQPDRAPTSPSMVSHRAALQITSNASQATTMNWTTTRRAAVQMLIIVDVSGAAWSQTPSDSVTSSDSNAKTVGKALADSITSSDASTRAVGKSSSDSITMSDANVKAIIHISVDTVTMLDVITKAITHPLADSVTITDSPARTVTNPLADTVTITDANTKAVQLFKQDSITTSDIVSELSQYFRTAFDSVTITDHVDTHSPTTIIQTVADAIAITDRIKVLVNGKSIWYQRASSDFASADHDTWYARNSTEWSD